MKVYENYVQQTICHIIIMHFVAIICALVTFSEIRKKNKIANTGCFKIGGELFQCTQEKEKKNHTHDFY